jgi:hypothetical protein
MADTTEIHIGARTFIYATCCLVLAAIGLCLVMGGLLFWRENELLSTRRKLHKTQDRIETCLLDKAKLAGRVQSFEVILVRPQAHAVDTSITEYQRVTGKAPTKATLAEFHTWLVSTTGIGGNK